MNTPNVPSQVSPQTSFFAKVKAYFTSPEMKLLIKILWKILAFIMSILFIMIKSVNGAKSGSGSTSDSYGDDESSGEGWRHGHSGFGYYHDNGVKSDRH